MKFHHKLWLNQLIQKIQLSIQQLVGAHWGTKPFLVQQSFFEGLTILKLSSFSDNLINLAYLKLSLKEECCIRSIPVSNHLIASNMCKIYCVGTVGLIYENIMLGRWKFWLLSELLSTRFSIRNIVKLPSLRRLSIAINFSSKNLSWLKRILFRFNWRRYQSYQVQF